MRKLINTKENDRQNAKERQQKTKLLYQRQNEFLYKKSMESWKLLCGKFRDAMACMWGRPFGRFKKIIEEHGISINDIAVMNFMLCPAIGNRYTGPKLKDCWLKRTSILLGILRPRIIIAQGITVYRFLQQNHINSHVKLLLGIHHASRLSNLEKKKIFDQVKKELENAEYHEC